jgi:hypothetical protein
MACTGDTLPSLHVLELTVTTADDLTDLYLILRETSITGGE